MKLFHTYIGIRKIVESFVDDCLFAELSRDSANFIFNSFTNDYIFLIYIKILS